MTLHVRMMRRLLWGLGLLLVAPAWSSAQTAEGLDVSFGIGGGRTSPLQDAREVLKDGFNGQGFVRVGLGHVPLALRAGLNYQNFDLTHPIDLAGITRGGTHTLVGGLADLQLFLSGRKVRPYLLASGGAYALRTELDGEDGPAISDTRLSAGGGAGVEWSLEGLRIYFEGRIDHVFTSSDDPPDGGGMQIVPVSLGFVF